MTALDSRSFERSHMFERHRSALVLDKPDDPMLRCVELDYTEMLHQLLTEAPCPQPRLDQLLIKAASLGKTPACQLLLRFRSNPNAPASVSHPGTVSGETFTQSQAKERKWLRDHSPDGGSALHYAVNSGHLETVRLLIQSGANVNARDSAGVTPLMIAVANPEIKEVAMELLFHPTCDVNIQDSRHRRTTLHYAVEAGNYIVAETLLLSISDIDPRDRYGNTPLVLAASLSPSGGADSTETNHIRCIQALLIAGANRQTANNGGETALHKAVASEAKGIVALLLEAGCKVDLKILRHVCLDLQDVVLVRLVFNYATSLLKDYLLCGLLLALINDEPSKWEVGVYEKEVKAHEVAKAIMKSIKDRNSYTDFLNCPFQQVCESVGPHLKTFNLEHYKTLVSLGLCGYSFLKGKFSVAIMLYLSGCPLDLHKLHARPEFAKFCTDPFFLAWVQGYLEDDSSSEPDDGTSVAQVDNVLPYDANIHGIQEHALDGCYQSREDSKALIAAFMNIYN